MHNIVCALRVHSYSLILAPEGYVGHSRGALILLSLNTDSHDRASVFFLQKYTDEPIQQSLSTVELTNRSTNELMNLCNSQ